MAEFRNMATESLDIPGAQDMAKLTDPVGDSLSTLHHSLRNPRPHQKRSYRSVVGCGLTQWSSPSRSVGDTYSPAFAPAAFATAAATAACTAA